MDVRTTSHIVADMLELLIKSEWDSLIDVGHRNRTDYRNGCPDCSALQYAVMGEEPEHEPDCKRAKLIAEARAFLEAENLLAEAKGEDGVYVP